MSGTRPVPSKGAGICGFSLGMRRGWRHRWKEDLQLHLDPEILFARQWALALLEAVKARLQAYYVDAGRGQVYEIVYPYLRGETGLPAYSEAARQLGMTTAAVEITVRRMRRRYAVWLREEIARTVDDPADVDDEIRFLRKTLAT